MCVFALQGLIVYTQFTRIFGYMTNAQNSKTFLKYFRTF